MAKARKPVVEPGLAETFLRLRKILEPYAKYMVVKHDGPGIYYLESTPVPKYGTEVFFAAVQTQKSQVSFHLLPLHVFPEMLETLSPSLKKRLRGTSRFAFTTVDPATVRELTALTRRGYQGYRKGGVFAA